MPKNQVAAGIDLTEFNQKAEQLAELEVAGDTDNKAKRDLWIEMGQDLEDQDFPKHKIAQEIVKAVESRLIKYYKKKGIEPPKDKLKLNSGWFYVVMREKEWVSGKFGADPSPNGNGENSSDSDREVPAVSVESRRRNELLKFYYDMVKEGEAVIEELLRDQDEKIEEDGSVTLIDRDWGAILDGMALDDVEGPIAFARDLFYNTKEDRRRKLDSRQYLLPQIRPATLAICFFATNQDYADNHFKIVKNDPIITPKKLAQYLKDSNSFSDLCKLAMEDAFKIGLLELKCPDCESYALRIKLYKNGSWDLVCKNSDYHKNDIERAKTPEDKDLVRSNLEIIQSGVENIRYIRHYHPALLQYRLVCLRDNVGGAAYRYLERRFPEILKKVRNEPDEDIIAKLRASGELPQIDESRSTHEPT